MNREIKFRGKSPRFREWIYGSLICNKDASMILEYDEQSILSSQVHYIDPETIGQFTGLTTDGTQEIYEGDIVEFYDTFEFKRITTLVSWDKDFCSFVCAIGGEPVIGLSTAIVGFNDFELLGNIYDNPELLTLNSEQV